MKRILCLFLTIIMVFACCSALAATKGEENALRKAQSYLNLLAMSYNRLMEQLQYDGFLDSECKYAVDNCGADWYDQAAQKAENYLSLLSLSKSRLISQLEYDGFTPEQAQYGAAAAYGERPSKPGGTPAVSSQKADKSTPTEAPEDSANESSAKETVTINKNFDVSSLSYYVHHSFGDAGRKINPVILTIPIEQITIRPLRTVPYQRKETSHEHPSFSETPVRAALFLCLLWRGRGITGSGEKTGLPSDEEMKAWRTILDDLLLDDWQNYEGVVTGDNWFDVCRLPGNTFAIIEMLHEQCVMAFLIIGEEKALLFDTCTGIQNVRRVVEKLTDLPVTVLNSHDHFDHIGGNAYFDEVWCYNLPSAIQHLTQGPTETEQFEALDSSKSIHQYLKHYGLTIPESIPGKAPTGTVEDGQIIDLGGRKLEVIHTPGHQPSCIMLLDRENKLLFTGDMFYPGPMYCLFDDSSFPDYVRSIRKVADLAVEIGIEEVYCSHNLASVATGKLCQFADYLEAIERGEITDYELEDDGFRFYAMDDRFAILLPDEGTEPVTGYSVPAEDP